MQWQSEREILGIQFSIFFISVPRQTVSLSSFFFYWSVKQIIACLLQESFDVKQTYLTYLDAVGSFRGVCVLLCVRVWVCVYARARALRQKHARRHTQVHTLTHTYALANSHAHSRTYTLTHPPTHRHTHVHTDTLTLAHTTHTQTLTHPFSHVILSHPSTQIGTHTCSHTHTHILTHTHCHYAIKHMHFPWRSVEKHNLTVCTVLCVCHLGTSRKSAFLCVITQKVAVFISVASEDCSHAPFMSLLVSPIMHNIKNPESQYTKYPNTQRQKDVTNKSVPILSNYMDLYPKQQTVLETGNVFGRAEDLLFGAANWALSSTRQIQASLSIYLH
jgi:hypothetical protein